MIKEDFSQEEKSSIMLIELLATESGRRKLARSLVPSISRRLDARRRARNLPVTGFAKGEPLMLTAPAFYLDNWSEKMDDLVTPVRDQIVLSMDALVSLEEENKLRLIPQEVIIYADHSQGIFLGFRLTGVYRENT